MTAPRSAFAELMRLKNAHLKKVRRSTVGRAVYFERLLDEILSPLAPAEGFPAFLSLDDQGRFPWLPSSAQFPQQRQRRDFVCWFRCFR